MSALQPIVELRVNDKNIFTNHLPVDKEVWNLDSSCCVNTVSPLHSYMLQVLDAMLAKPFDCRTNHVLCILTYVSNVCVSKLLRNESVDIAMVFGNLIEHLMHKIVNLTHIISLLK